MLSQCVSWCFIGHMTTQAARLLKPAEFGDRIGLSRATVYRLINNGTIRTVGVGVTANYTRIEESEVQRYIESQRRNKVA